MGMNHDKQVKAEIASNRPVKHGVYVKYGLTSFRLSTKDLELITAGLEVLSPDSSIATTRAQRLAASFWALQQYSQTVK